MTRVRHTIVQIDIAQQTQCARWTRASVIVDQIVACAAILARIRLTVVNVQFAILALEAWRTCTLVHANQIFAHAIVLAR